jgi:hypothetical protein
MGGGAATGGGGSTAGGCLEGRGSGPALGMAGIGWVELSTVGSTRLGGHTCWSGGTTRGTRDGATGRRRRGLP